MQPLDVYKYYALLAEELGSQHAKTEDGEVDREQEPREIKQANFSVSWFFEASVGQNTDYSDRYEALGDIAKAYLGDSVINRQLNWNETIDNTVIDSVTMNTELNASQQQAIIKAISKPVSLIQGPPGTGKTRTIVEMIRTIIDMGKTVAVMSCNNSALKAISEQIEKIDGQHPEREALGDKVAVLGSISNREKFESIPVSEEDPTPLFRFRAGSATEYTGATYGGGKYKREANISAEVFTNVYPCVISTIHSIRNCFADGMEYRYDYVIIDESSQVPMHLGLIAADVAHHLVLVGDDKQLPPVIFKERLDILRENHPEVNYEDLGYYRQSEDVSFLGTCTRIFGNRDNYVFLDQHYRCHPGIIGFCRKYVYGDRLSICTQGQGVPVSVIWYEGDYGASYSEINTDGQREFFSRVNYRQIRIFLMDEYEKLLEKIEAGKSVSILSPYRGQLRALQRAISEYNEIHNIDLNVVYNEERSNRSDDDDISYELPCLTIHKSQGREFDIVYLLPVDDDCKNRQGDAPWTQKERLINVATSRAKEELHIIASLNILSKEIQERILGYSFDEEIVNEQLLFMTQLIEYVFEYYEDKPNFTENGFGFKPATPKSIFDKMSYEKLDGQQYSSYFEDCIGNELVRGTVLSTRELSFVHEMSLNEIIRRSPSAKEKYDEADEDIKRFVDCMLAHMDFAIINANGELIADIEVDGRHHFDEIQKVRDEKKDYFLNEILGVPVIRLKIDGSKNGNVPETQWDDGSDEFTYIKSVLDREIQDETKERYVVR